MTLREVTRTVISLFENASGCPLVVSEDASRKTLAASRIAYGGNKIRAIFYNPSAVSAPDYLIWYQCGFQFDASLGSCIKLDLNDSMKANFLKLCEALAPITGLATDEE